jgi:hypothetical protein
MGLASFLYKDTDLENEVIYWWKENHIHNWFITHCGTVDNCSPIRVSRDRLQELVNLLEALDEDSVYKQQLPVLDGFFFGSQEYSEGYWWSVRRTEGALKKVLAEHSGDFVYQASW